MCRASLSLLDCGYGSSWCVRCLCLLDATARFASKSRSCRLDLNVRGTSRSTKNHTHSHVKSSKHSSMLTRVYLTMGMDLRDSLGASVYPTKQRNLPGSVVAAVKNLLSEAHTAARRNISTSHVKPSKQPACVRAYFNFLDCGSGSSWCVRCFC